MAISVEAYSVFVLHHLQYCLR